VSTVLLAAVAVAAVTSQNNLLFWAMGVIASAILVSLLLSHLTMRSLTIRRLDPNHGVVGEPMLVRYEVANRSRFLPAFNLHLSELPVRDDATWRRFMPPAPAWIMHVGPGEAVHGEAVFWPQKRGEMRFGALRCATRFPFGIVRRTRRRSQPTHTLVYPRRYRLKRGVLDAVVPAGPMGMKLSNRPGGGDDYFGLREYKPGDSRRQIAWKRSATFDTLVIKERTLPSPPRLRIVLNLTAPTADLRFDRRRGVDPRTLEEQAISLAATMIDAAYHDGYEVGLSVLGADVPVTPMRRSHWHVEKMMGALAAIDLDAARPPVDHRALADSERAGIITIHPGRVDPSVVRHDGWHFSAEQLDHLVHDGDPPANPERPAPGAKTPPDGGRREDAPSRQEVAA